MYQTDRIFKRLQIQSKIPNRSKDGIVGRRKRIWKGSEAGMNLATARDWEETTGLESSEGGRGKRAEVARSGQQCLWSLSQRKNRLRPPTMWISLVAVGISGAFWECKTNEMARQGIPSICWSSNCLKSYRPKIKFQQRIRGYLCCYYKCILWGKSSTRDSF